MPNGFDKIRLPGQLSGQGLRPVEFSQMGIDGGLRMDESPRTIPLDASPNMDRVRFEHRGLRKEFGFSGVGTAAATKVLALLEHKYVSSGTEVKRLIRLLRTASQCEIEEWGGSSWASTKTSTEQIENTLLSAISTQSEVLVADGKIILRWYSAYTTQEDEFPSGNSLTTVGDTADATISPAGGVDDEYDINYSVDITIDYGSDATVTVALEHDGVEVTTEDFSLASGSETWDDWLLEVVESVSDGDTLTLKIKSATATTEVIDDNWSSGGTYLYEVTKSITPEADDDNYTYFFEVTGTSGTLDVEFLYDDGGGWTSLGTEQYNSTGVQSKTWNVDGLGAGTEFAIDDAGFTGDFGLNGAGYYVRYSAWGLTIDIHGYNKATDGDAFAGVVYQTGPVDTFEEASADAPGASYIFPFAGRVVALQDEGDVQSLAWSVLDSTSNWADSGSGQIYLTDSPMEGLDDLMSAIVLGPQTAAVLRKNSIMRLFPTGNAAQALGATGWINGIGTESPFSAKIVRGGGMFLGSDMMPYYISPSGVVPIGHAVHQWIIDNLTTYPENVDAMYDPEYQEYYLGIPVTSSETITKVLVFDVGEFLDRQRQVWRYLTRDIERMAVVSEVS